MKVEIKIGDLVEKIKTNVKVKTPYGFKKILNSIKTKPEREFYLETESGLFLNCADKHRVETESNGWLFVCDLTTEKIKTINGFEKIKIVKDLNTTKEMYDIQVEETKSYWSNGIHSHNSEIIKALADEFNCIYHKLEIQKIPIEEFEGFPYLEDRDGVKVTRLASPTVLPPSGDDRVWLLHLDEFNKADSEKMAAVMNLVLTGEIGGSADFNNITGKSEKYRLPKKTIIIGSGNFKTQDNTENLNLVNQMDIATSERFHRVVLLDYNAESWLKNFAVKTFSFGFNGDSHTVSSRIAPILMHYIMDKMREDNNRSPFLIPISFRPDEGGGERTTSPRSWTLVSDNMLLDAIVKFEELSSKEFSYYSDIANNEFGYSGEDRVFDMFFQDPNNQIKFLANQTNEFGLEGHKLVAEIISRYSYFAENRILAEEIVFDYLKVKKKILEVKNKAGIILYLLISTGYLLDRLVREEAGDLKKIAVSLSTYFEDTDISTEDLCAFIHIIFNSKNDVAKEVHEYLNSFSKRYKNAFGDFYYTSKREI